MILNNSELTSSLFLNSTEQGISKFTEFNIPFASITLKSWIESNEYFSSTGLTISFILFISSTVFQFGRLLNL